jgi:hypothetical protein
MLIIVNRNAWPYLLLVADMYQVERLKLHCASKMWDMTSEEIVTSFLRWAIRANCTQLQEKCMPLLERIFPHKILTYDWAVVYTDHAEFMQIFVEDPNSFVSSILTIHNSCALQWR